MSRSLQLTSGPHLSLMLSFLHCLDFYHPELSAQQILVPNFWKVFKYLNEPQTEVATSTVQCVTVQSNKGELRFCSQNHLFFLWGQRAILRSLTYIIYCIMKDDLSFQSAICEPALLFCL